jgi:hypothetical protein
MIHLGTGPTLREACIWMRDPKERHRRIVDAAERNSVIAGLPPFSPELWQALLRRLEAMATAVSER